MIKLGLLASVAAGIMMGANVAGNVPQQTHAPLNTKLIVEVDRSLESLTKEGIKNVQNSLLNRIRSEVTTNVMKIGSYKVLNNAICISVNEQYVDQITKLNGVKSVTRNELHWITNNDDPEPSDNEEEEDDDDIEPITPDEEHDYGGTTNISAVTMKKPGSSAEYTGSTNDGEGTLIAILDNEFYFRADYYDPDANEGQGGWVDAEFYHHTFSPLPEGTMERLKPHYNERFHINLCPVEAEGTIAYKYATDPQTVRAGREGSLYFNSKVPFYFDYGGETKAYAEEYHKDYDVHSLSSYHGSHVASLAAGNDPYYKGIAPKAQLVCMKVFTNFESNNFVDGLGLGSSSGAYDMPILDALEDCMTLGVDGINMSLGSNLDDFDSDSITLRTLTKLADEGILSAISAGNSGKTSYADFGGAGNWTQEMTETGILSSYANNPGVTTVASGQPTEIFYTKALSINGEFIPYEDQVTNREGMPKDYKVEHKLKDIVEGDLTKSVAWQYVPGFGAAGDYTGLDVQNSVIVVNRGSISFEEKYNTAMGQSGNTAKALVIVNNDPTSTDFNFHCSFGDTQPEIPVVLVLYKDKSTFSVNKHGTFKLIENQKYTNVKAYTASTFSSDGATFDLDLKPEITTPGDLVRGAVPPQTKQDKKYRDCITYEFLSGTSMSAPNYAGAQSVVLSKYAADAESVFNKTYPDTEQGKKDREADLLKYYAYRNTVDMRLMSTAEPFKDFTESPEKYKGSNVKTLTSPRIQGAGMVNLGAAYNTDVYLEGIDGNGNASGKAKIALRNSDAINRGELDLKFNAYNESETEDHTYGVYLTVMRPAIKNDNHVVSKEYHNNGEIDDITSWVGHSYYKQDPEDPSQYIEVTVPGDINNKDYYVVTRDIEYYDNAADAEKGYYDEENGTWSCVQCGHLHNEGTHCDGCNAEKSEENIKNFHTIIPAGRYYYDKLNNTWLELPEYDYQSTQDVYIEEELFIKDVTIEKAGKTEVEVQYNLDTATKQAIEDFFECGTYIEGYVTLKATDGSENLNMVYLGFYAGEGKSYEDADPVEPFNFEKETSRVYPSDLVNDVTKSLIGKDFVDFGSTWIAGYVEPGTQFSLEDIEVNDNSLSNLAETTDTFHYLGYNPDTEEMFDDVENNLYVGNAYKSNTMIIQQFVLRSIADNYISIKNKTTGVEVYRSVLIDSIRSYGYMNMNPLYKSHIEDTYLGSYTAHKALAVVPLYDPMTREAFPDGQYDITFNYLLAGTHTWVNKSYTIIIDSTPPKVSKFSVDQANEKVRFDIEDANLSYVTIGATPYEIKEDETGQYIELSTKKDIPVEVAEGVIVYESELFKLINDNMNDAWGEGRLYMSLVDKACGEMGVILRLKYTRDFMDVRLDHYLLAQHPLLESKHDINDLGREINIVYVNAVKQAVNETNEDIVNFVEIVKDGEKFQRTEIVIYTVTEGGCGGNIATTSITLSTLSITAVILLVIAKKRRKLEVTNDEKEKN